jgi:hypothetical protein
VLTAPVPLLRVLSVAAEEFRLRLSRSVVGDGAVTIEFRNIGEDPHDLRLLDLASGEERAAWPLLEAGDGTRPTSATRLVTLGTGEYEAYCSIADHAVRGMRARFTVLAG